MNHNDIQNIWQLFKLQQQNSFIIIRQATHNEISEEAAKFKSTKINNYHFQKDAFAKIT